MGVGRRSKFQIPPDLTREEAVAYDVAAALLHHGTLPELSYRAAVQTFGQNGAAELIYLVGLYCLVSVTLNGFDVPVPSQQRDENRNPQALIGATRRRITPYRFARVVCNALRMCSSMR